MKRRSSRAASAALALLGTTTAAWADRPPEDDGDEIIVRGEPPPRSASATSRDARELTAAPQSSGSELLRTVPGVALSQHSGQGKAHQIFFRGFDAAHGQDIELSVGGVPVNEVSNIHGQGYADLHFVIPEVVERVDALPGTYDPAQGDFAVAGTMRFVLGYDQPGFTALGGYGSFDARRVFFAYHPDHAPRETFGAFEAYQSDGFGAGRKASRASAVGQLLHPLGKDLSLRVLVASYAGRFGSAGVLRTDDVDAGRIDRFGSYDTQQGGSSTRTQLSAELRHDDGDAELLLAPYVVLRSLQLRFDYTGYLVHPVAGDSTVQRNDATTTGFTAEYRKRLHLFRADDAVAVGVVTRADFIEQSQDSVAVLDGQLVEPVVDARVRASSVGAYVDAELHPLRRVLLRGGARAEMASFSVEDELTKRAPKSSQGLFFGERLSANVAIAPGLHGVASWGRGFRTPQARGIVDGAPLRFAVVRSAELGLRYAERSGARRFEASVAGFRTTLDRDVVFDERVARNEPVPGTQRLGAALNVETSLGAWFTSAFGATVTRATFSGSDERYSKGDAVPYAPAVVTRADLALRPHLGHLAGHGVTGHLGLGLQGLFHRPLPYGERARDAFVADARVGARFEHVALWLDVRNVLDLTWNDSEFAYTSSFERGGAPTEVPARHFMAGEPRSFFLSAELRLGGHTPSSEQDP